MPLKDSISLGVPFCVPSADAPLSAFRLSSGKAQEFEPVRMVLSGHQFFWAFADTLGTVTAKEGAVIEEELQQVEIRCAQLTAEEKIVAQPRVEVFDE